jgi:DNA-binding HxlR family transcriptional regulator
VITQCPAHQKLTGYLPEALSCDKPAIAGVPGVNRPANCNVVSFAGVTSMARYGIITGESGWSRGSIARQQGYLVLLQEWESAEQVLAMVAGKGKLRVMATLRTGPLRYSQIQQRLNHTISETNLNRARRQLVDDGLIRVLAAAPDRPVADGYELTEAGIDLLDGLDNALSGWLNGHFAHIGPQAAHRRSRRSPRA